MTNDALELLQQLPGSQQDGSHPRPTLLRQAWVGLDRQVGFAHDDQLVGLDEHWERTSAPFQQQIQLPFPPESEASGVGDAEDLVGFDLPVGDQVPQGPAGRLVGPFGQGGLLVEPPPDLL